MNLTKSPIASLVSSQKMTPRLRGRSEAQGRSFRGFTNSDSQRGFYSLDPLAASPFLDPQISPVVWYGPTIRPGVLDTTTPSGVKQSTVQDKKSGVSTPSVLPKTAVGNFSSSKPYWVHGKPKCKTGFRYDFKRRLCIKIK